MFFIRVFLLYLLITVSINALNLDSSRIWLKNSLNSNLSNHDIATPYQIYKEARLIMDDSRGDTKVLFASELNTTEFLANKIIAYKESNLDTIHLVEQLKILQNSDGGFGHTKGHQSNPIDSALALEAISWIDNNTITHSLVSYLLSQQKSNGSWQDAIITDDTIYTTSIVLRALWLERKSFNVSSYLLSARDYLISQVQNDGSYGEVYQSALVLRSIAPLSYSKEDFRDTINYLSSIQQSNGSWEDSPYTTALVIQALEMADKDVPNPDLATLTGILIDDESNTPLEGVTVNLVGENNLTLTTNAQGEFSFNGLRNGNYLLQIVDSEYANLSSSVILSGDDIHFNTIRLSQQENSTVSILKGVIKDANTNEPLSGVTITIGTKTAVTDSDGNYIINSLESGSYTITITKSGYYTFTNSVSIPVNTMLYYNASLSKTKFISPIDDGNLSIVGVVSDANSSEPLENVIVEYKILDGNSSSLYTNIDGNYSIAIGTPSELLLKFSKLGYQSREFSVKIENSKLNISPTLEPIFLENGENNASISATVIDSITSQLLSDVSIHVMGDITNRELLNDYNGSFNIRNIKSYDINISFEKNGYHPTNSIVHLYN